MRCPFSTFLCLQGDHHCACAQKWCHFSFFFQLRAFKQNPWAYAERFWGGFTKSSWGSGGRCEPPSGVRGRAPEGFEINAFQRLRTPVSLSFLSQCCYTKIHAIFFIHSHPHHFQLNEVVPNHTLWYQKKPMSKNCPILSLVLHLHHEACWCSEFWKQFLTVFQGQKKLFTVISTCTLCQCDGREYSLYMRAWLTVFTLRWCLATLTMP